MRRARLAAALLLLLAAAAVLLGGAEARRGKRNGRKKSVSKAIRQRTRLCERGECKGLLDEDPNCVPRCVSAECFGKVFGGNELEPGEIDTRRLNDFDACCRTLPADTF